MVMAIQIPINPRWNTLLKKYAVPIRNTHIETIAIIIVHMTSPAARNVLGREKEGTHAKVHMQAWNRITCTASSSVSGVR